MSDEMAKAIHDTGMEKWPHRWERMSEGMRDEWRRHAQSARDYYGIPESAERGAVTKAAEMLRGMCAGCEQPPLGGEPCHLVDSCPTVKAFMLLGGHRDKGRADELLDINAAYRLCALDEEVAEDA